MMMIKHCVTMEYVEQDRGRLGVTVSGRRQQFRLAPRRCTA